MVEQVKNPGFTEAHDDLIHYIIDSKKLLDKGEWTIKREPIL
jgi:hypothetical protein